MERRRSADGTPMAECVCGCVACRVRTSGFAGRRRQWRQCGVSACRRRDRWRIALPSLARSRARSRFWRCRAASVGGANRIARNGRVVCYRAQSGRHSRCGS
ncbi:hypothetical protein DP43_5827 [Burkholderia pseudomallei]|nr:hypothetical protein DP43_5827 [Burkholderia pseudomallei]